MIVIYTPKVTNRIKYTLDFVFTQYFGIAYQLIQQIETAFVPEHTYINYSTTRMDGYLNIFQDTLLLEENIVEQKIFITKENNLPVFFQTLNQYDIRFDIFSCIFYLISRYEEYLLHEQDEHGRYKSSNSILAKPEFNFSPIVEEWLLFLKSELLKRNNLLSFKEYTFEYLPTFDVDLPFKYLGRNWKKHLPDISTLECWKTLLGKQRDRFDIFSSIFDELKQQQLPAIFFFLLNDDSKNNSKVSPHSAHYKNLITSISKQYAIGWHPSYDVLKQNLFDEEQAIFKDITQANPILSRQHFLRIKFPAYYTALLATSVQTDYSLCYPDVIGFRAGCSRPFYFYNLEKNETTHLLIQPSCWMDASYAYYKQNFYEDFSLHFSILEKQLKKINGKLVAIFHNDLLSLGKYWKYFIFINTRNNN